MLYSFVLESVIAMSGSGKPPYFDCVVLHAIWLRNRQLPPKVGMLSESCWNVY